MSRTYFDFYWGFGLTIIFAVPAVFAIVVAVCPGLALFTARRRAVS